MSSSILPAASLKEVALQQFAPQIWDKFHSIYPKSDSPTKEEWMTASSQWAYFTDVCEKDKEVPPELKALWKAAHVEFGISLREKI